MGKVTVGIAVGDGHAKYHDKRAVAVVRKVIDAVKPSEFVSIGDMLNYAPYSRHGKRNDESPNELVGVDHAGANELLDVLLGGSKIKKKVWIDGNHEGFQDEFFTEFPQFFDAAIHRYQILGLKKRGFGVILPEKGVYKSGKLHFLHGWRAGVTAVRTHLIQDYKANFIQGHIHRSDTATSSNIQGNIVQGYSIGCLCKRDWRYSSLSTSNHGFALYYILPNGNFTVHNVVIINYTCIIDGQVFSA